VGRAPIDEEAIRLLEQHNPDVQFDWGRLLRGAESGGGEGADRPLRNKGAERGAEGAERRLRSRDAERGKPGRGDREERRERDRGEHRRDAIAAASAPVAAPSAVDDSSVPSERSAVSALSATEAPSALSATEALSALSAAHQRLGSEALGRLRARYAEVMARIAEQEVDDQARDELKSRAERLNPDTWVTADEVAAALEQYETVFEELRALVGRHPRGRRGR
jgi:hypothetical protein